MPSVELVRLAVDEVAGAMGKWLGRDKDSCDPGGP